MMYTDLRVEWMLRQELAKQMFQEANQIKGGTLRGKISNWMKGTRDRANQTQGINQMNACGC